MFQSEKRLCRFNTVTASSLSILVRIFVVLHFLSFCSAQLTFHTDANTNSFTLKAPGLQQSFTRYFGGQMPKGSLLQQPTAAAGGQLQPQQQQQQTLAQAYQQQQPQQSLPQFYQQQQQQLLQQHQQQQLQQNAQFTTQYPYAAYSWPYHMSDPNQFPNKEDGALAQQYIQRNQQEAQAQAQALALAQAQQQQQPQYQQEQSQQPQYQQDQQTPQQQAALEKLYAAYNSYNNQQKFYTSQPYPVQQQYYQQQLTQQLYNQQPMTQQMKDEVNLLSRPNRNFYTAEQHATFLRQQQDQVAAVQRQQMQQQYYQRSSAANSRGSESSTLAPYMAQVEMPAEADKPGKIVNYSPSDTVSHVKFSSKNLNYNF